MFFCASAPVLGGSEKLLRGYAVMTTVGRTLHVGQEHELLVRLESAGLTSPLAQAIIESPQNALAEMIVASVKGSVADQSRAKAEILTNIRGYNFTDRLAMIFQSAQKESNRLRHEYIGTEHILLGLIQEGDGVGITALQNLNVELDELVSAIENTVKRGKATKASDTLPYTSRAKKVVELAMAESRLLKHEYVGSEHLVLGLLREEKGIAAQCIHDLLCPNIPGDALELVRREVCRLLSTPYPPEEDLKKEGLK